MLRITKYYIHQIKRNISALYVTGDKAKENYAILTPYFDFKNRLNNRDGLQENLNQRYWDHIDLTQIYQMWHVYRDIQIKKENMEKRRQEIADALKKIGFKGDDDNTGDNKPNENLIRKYKLEGITLREDLKMLKEKSYHLEDTFIQEYLALPNNLNKLVKIDDEVLYTYLEPTSNQQLASSHLSHTNLINFIDSDRYYLTKEAAQFDLTLPHHCVDLFKKHGFLQCSNPDFCRSILVEAAGLNVQQQAISVKDESAESLINLLHLVGGGTMVSYLGYITKLSIFKSALPIKLISTGRQYIQSVNKQNDIKATGLYACSQSTQVELFVATSSANETDKVFNSTLEQIMEFYKQLNQHFRIVRKSAAELNQAECLRVSIEMYSPYLQQYVEVGSLSNLSDYISKRLLFCYRESGSKDTKFPYLISGNVVNVTKLLAILLENQCSLQLKCLDNTK